MGMARPVVVIVAVVVAVEVAATPPASRRLGRDEPVIVGCPSAEVRWRLQRAHADALQRLEELPTCRALFESLGADGRDTRQLKDSYNAEEPQCSHRSFPPWGT